MLTLERSASGDGRPGWRMRLDLPAGWWSQAGPASGDILLIYQPPARMEAPTAASIRSVWQVLQQRCFPRLPVLLGLDYALVAVAGETGAVSLARGGIGRTALFFRFDDAGLVVADDLPRPGEHEDVDPDGVAAYLSNCASAVPADTVHTTRTLQAGAGWRRVPRSAVVELTLGQSQVGTTPHQLPVDEPYRDLDDDGLMNAFRDAIARHAVARAVGRTAVELSGGIDSTTLAVALQSADPASSHCGMSLTYPYHEFRHEQRYVEAAYARVGWQGVRLDGSRTLLFDSPTAVFDPPEPTRLASGYAQLSAVTMAAIDAGARSLFNGHGADQIFGMSPYDRQSLFKPGIDLGLLHAPLAARVREHIDAMRRVHEDGDPRGHRHFFAGLMLYDRWVPSPVGSDLACDPALLSVETLQLSWEVFRRPRWARPGYPGKPFAREAFAPWLPPCILERRWKVGYDGLYRRGLARNATRLVAMLARQREHLESIGISVERCIERIERCRAFHFENMELLIGVLGYCVWRETRVSARPGDALRT